MKQCRPFGSRGFAAGRKSAAANPLPPRGERVLDVRARGRISGFKKDLKTSNTL